MTIPDNTQTIAAPASAPGGALSLVRISGPYAFQVAASFLKPASALINLKLRFAYLLTAQENDRTIDTVLATFYKAPRSYTGEDVVEIVCHGSSYIITNLLRLAAQGGAREAMPGEFTLRAFLNGKLDLAQAEAVNDLITAESETAHRAAISQLHGQLSKKMEILRLSLINLLSELEVRIDDSYEEMPEINLQAFQSEVKKVREEISALTATFAIGKNLKHGLRVVITGSPNSGKSSLLNRLAGRNCAIVSKKAGTTRDIIETRTEIGGLTVIFSDTAGLNPDSKDALEREGMRRAAAALKAADFIFWVQDISKKVSKADEKAKQTIKRFASPGAEVITIFNKADLKPVRQENELHGALKVSCKANLGLDELKLKLAKNRKADTTASIITSARQHAALTNAQKELLELEKLLSGKSSRSGVVFGLELAAERLKNSLSALAEITGETTAEEILSNIFKNFCIGK